MIKIEKRKTPPKILIVNQKDWTKELLDSILLYGSFDKIPTTKKKVFQDRYKHQEIKNVLIPKLETKCAFCESIPNESGYIEVEHFFPKSKYPAETYDWLNLLPSCKRCNLKKKTLDTKKKPIIKPDQDDPEIFLEYDSIIIKVKDSAPDKRIAKRTIDKLELNQYRLIKPRSELLLALTNYELALGKILKEFAKSQNINKKIRLINAILESLDEIKALKENEKKFSGFAKDYIKKSEIINEATEIVAIFQGIS